MRAEPPPRPRAGILEMLLLGGRTGEMGDRDIVGDRIRASGDDDAAGSQERKLNFWSRGCRSRSMVGISGAKLQVLEKSQGKVMRRDF